VPGKSKRKRRLMRVSRACEYGAISRTTAMRLIEEGKITAYRQGGLIMVDLDTMDKYFDSLPRLPSGGRRER
jgi:excisionase family DNA binding protein